MYNEPNDSVFLKCEQVLSVILKNPENLTPNELDIAIHKLMATEPQSLMALKKTLISSFSELKSAIIKRLRYLNQCTIFQKEIVAMEKYTTYIPKTMASIDDPFIQKCLCYMNKIWNYLGMINFVIK